MAIIQMTNAVVLHMAKELKEASKKNKAPIWSRLAELALKPSSARRTVNVSQINKLTKDGDKKSSDHNRGWNKHDCRKVVFTCSKTST